ncbi:MAG: hypothetical protein NXY57DRAFT_1038216 [Lentinula lateritia]|nr:MAG: hypothetical protein NXY57DRAFT_1038216 [Lentinula lateritia]
MLHKVASSIYQTLFIFFFLSVGIATVMASPLPPVSRSAQLERRDNSGGRIVPSHDGTPWTWLSPSILVSPFGKEALALCVGARDCFAVWPKTIGALLPLSAVRLDPPKYSDQQRTNLKKLSTLSGKVNFKSSSYTKFAHLPEKSTIFKLLENVNEIAKQTGLSIMDDISYLSASLALLKNQGVLEDPDKTQEDWATYKGKVKKRRLEKHEREERIQAARQGNMKLSFMLNP